MSTGNPQLIKVDPQRVTVIEPLLRPTRWDLMAVEEDLIEYVSHSRVIKATPLLGIFDDALVLINGLPFLRAAQRARPPLNDIVCLLEADAETVSRFGLESVAPGHMLDLFSEGRIYWAVESLTFRHTPTEELRGRVETKIITFFNTVTAAPDVYGGNYLSLSEFHWDTERPSVTWRWERSDRAGEHLSAFIKTLLELDAVISIKSWNGMDLRQMSIANEL